jgi:hypothetical protein
MFNHRFFKFNTSISCFRFSNGFVIFQGILVLWIRKSLSFLEKKWRSIIRVLLMLFLRGRICRCRFSRITRRFLFISSVSYWIAIEFRKNYVNLLVYGFWM